MAENKFAKKEKERKATVISHSSAGEMAEAIPKKKMISVNMPEDMQKKFTFINKKKGLSNTAVINILVAEYVKNNGEML